MEADEEAAPPAPPPRPAAQLLLGPRGLEDGNHEVTTESSAVPTQAWWAPAGDARRGCLRAASLGGGADALWSLIHPSRGAATCKGAAATWEPPRGPLSALTEHCAPRRRTSTPRLSVTRTGFTRCPKDTCW